MVELKNIGHLNVFDGNSERLTTFHLQERVCSVKNISSLTRPPGCYGLCQNFEVKIWKQYLI